MGRKGIETLVGLFVLLGLLAVVFLALKAANLATFRVGGTYAVTAKFDNIGGLKVRAPVKSAGVTIGRVAAIALDTSSYQGTVTMELEQGIAFPTDTSAKILTSGLLGDQYIGLEAWRFRAEPEARRPDQDDAVRRRAGEPDQPVPVQQGRRTGRGTEVTGRRTTDDRHDACPSVA